MIPRGAHAQDATGASQEVTQLSDLVVASAVRSRKKRGHLKGSEVLLIVLSLVSQEGSLSHVQVSFPQSLQ